MVLLGVVVCCAGLGGCASERKLNISPQQRKAKAVKAYDAALAAIMREPSLNVDVIWALKEILKLTPNKTLRQFVNDKTASIEKHPSLRLIDPNAPRIDLPENPASRSEEHTSELQSH